MVYHHETNCTIDSITFTICKQSFLAQFLTEAEFWFSYLENLAGSRQALSRKSAAFRCCCDVTKSGGKGGFL
jgi:hypothetical protein